MKKIRKISFGEILKSEFIDPSNITVGELAKDLNESEKDINDIISGKKIADKNILNKLRIYFGGSIMFWANLHVLDKKDDE